MLLPNNLACWNEVSYNKREHVPGIWKDEEFGGANEFMLEYVHLCNSTFIYADVICTLKK